MCHLKKIQKGVFHSCLASFTMVGASRHVMRTLSKYKKETPMEKNSDCSPTASPNLPFV